MTWLLSNKMDPSNKSPSRTKNKRQLLGRKRPALPAAVDNSHRLQTVRSNVRFHPVACSFQSNTWGKTIFSHVSTSRIKCFEFDFSSFQASLWCRRVTISATLCHLRFEKIRQKTTRIKSRSDLLAAIVPSFFEKGPRLVDVIRNISVGN